MDGSTFYREIGYSVTALGNGRWQWKLYPKKVPDVLRTVVSGEISGTFDDAVVAAKAAIDALLQPAAA